MDRDWLYLFFGTKSEPYINYYAKGYTPPEYENISINDMGLSTRASNCLLRCGCKTLEDIISISPRKIMAINCCGNKTFDEISKAVKCLIYEKGSGE